MGLGQYNILGEYCGPHTASSVFLILLLGVREGKHYPIKCICPLKVRTHIILFTRHTLILHHHTATQLPVKTQITIHWFLADTLVTYRLYQPSHSSLLIHYYPCPLHLYIPFIIDPKLGHYLIRVRVVLAGG